MDTYGKQGKQREDRCVESDGDVTHSDVGPICRIEAIWGPDEYSYEAYGFIPTLSSYVHPDTYKRPGILIVPGGGYHIVSPSEGEIVAMRFYAMGYQAFVLTYTTYLEESGPLGKQPLYDAARAVSRIRRRKEEYRVQPDCLGICGFSAGGHLSASLAVHFDDEDVQEKVNDTNIRPDYAILCYPVISAGSFGHRGSITALCGDPADEKLSAYMSLEYHVKENTPPVFVWHTMDDESVPVQNSFCFVSACRKRQVSAEMHIFRSGSHGLSLADEEWERGIFGGLEVAAQQEAYRAHCARTGRKMPVRLQGYMAYIDGLRRGENMMANLDARCAGAHRSIAYWPDLADAWIHSPGFGV